MSEEFAPKQVVMDWTTYMSMVRELMNYEGVVTYMVSLVKSDVKIDYTVICDVLSSRGLSRLVVVEKERDATEAPRVKVVINFKMFSYALVKRRPGGIVESSIVSEAAVRALQPGMVIGVRRLNDETDKPIYVEVLNVVETDADGTIKPVLVVEGREVKGGVE